MGHLISTMEFLVFTATIAGGGALVQRLARRDGSPARPLEHVGEHTGTD